MDSTCLGAQASKILRISNSDMKESLQGRHCTNHTDKKFYNRLTPHQMKKEKFELNAASTDNPQFDATHDLINPLENVIRFVDVLYRFIRPYVAIGTVNLNRFEISALLNKGVSPTENIVISNKTSQHFVKTNKKLA
ncbi:hypothetical protein Hanom_Chr09g00781321 [Helianthus anomalus]